MTVRDADFSQVTKDRLAKRAGHQCSNPSCSAPTSGAALSAPALTVNQGKAAHIIAAATNGPRGDASLTDNQRKDESNGVWLCAACADLVDKNGGVDYPKEMLQKWKAEREAASAREVGRPASLVSIIDGHFEAHGVSNVTGLDVQGPARLQPGTHAIATGANGVTGARFGGGSASAPPAPSTRPQIGRVAASFGVMCQACGFRAGAYGNGGGTPGCPDCGGVLVADPNALPALGNASCPCGWGAGLAVGVTKCPDCGRPL